MNRPSTLDIGHLLIAANRAMGSRASARIRELGVTPQQAVALLAIDSTPDRSTTPTQIANFMAADSPTVSGVIRRLEQRGLVTTSPNPLDRRSRLVALTDRAEAVLPGIRDAVRESSARAESIMPAEDLELLTGLLERFVLLLEDTPR